MGNGTVIGMVMATPAIMLQQQATKHSENGSRFMKLFWTKLMQNPDR
jgi:hypothetical protein